MSLCPKCGRAMCDHTAEERAQTEEQMLRILTPEEELVSITGDDVKKLMVAQKIVQQAKKNGNIVRPLLIELVF
jgi:hypothetical protein